MKISQRDRAAFSRVMSQYGRLAAGVPKTMSPAALEQRRVAGRKSAEKRLAQSKKQRSPKRIPRLAQSAKKKKK